MRAICIIVCLYLATAWSVRAGNDDPESSVQTETNSPSGGSPTNYGYIVASSDAFHEDMSIAGTPHALHYASQRTLGNLAAYQVKVWYGDPNSFPADLNSVSLTVSIAGRTFSHAAQAPFTNSYWTMDWDGLDVNGNTVYGIVKATVRSVAIFKRYLRLSDFENSSSDDLYVDPDQFRVGSWTPNTSFFESWLMDFNGMYRIEGTNYSRDELYKRAVLPHWSRKVKNEVAFVGNRPASSGGLGGWTFHNHHSYDTNSGMLYEGGGVDRKVRWVGAPQCSFDETNSVPTNEYAVLSSDGGSYYVFATNGIHQRTVDSLTGTNLFVFEYDASNLLVRIVDGQQRTTTVVRAASGQAQAIIGPYGLRTELNINTSGWLSALINPATETNRFLYSASGLLTNVVSRRGYTYTISYDSSGRAFRAEDPAGGYDEFQVSRVYGRTTVVRSYSMGRTNVTYNGWSQQWRKNAAGAVTETFTSPDGKTSDTTYPNGMKSSDTVSADPRFGVDLMQIAKSIQRSPVGLAMTTTIERSYALFTPTNPLSQLLAMTNIVAVNGRTSTVVYTFSDRTIRWISPMGRTNAVVYDSSWRPQRWDIPGLASVYAYYDAQGRAISVQQGARSVSLGYSTNGFLAAISNVLGQALLQRFDAIGRATNIVLPDSSVIGMRHQPASGPVGIAPPGQPEHNFGYSSVGLMERYSAPSVGGPTNMLLTWNPARQLTGITYPDGRSVSSVYDQASGFLLSRTWPENKVTNAYDCLCGRLSGLYATNGSFIRMFYDGGLLTNLVYGGVITGAVSFAYNNDFRVRAISNGGSNYLYGYDADGSLTNAGDLVLRRAADSGFLQASTLSSVTDTQDFNAFGEINSRTAFFAATSMYSVVHSYDLLGRITQRVEGVLGATQRWAYAYDSAGRLFEVYTNGGLRARYRYDANGNRTNAWVQGVGATNRYNYQDQLTNAAGVTVQFDAHGTMTNWSSGTAYRYDTRGSLMSAKIGTNLYEYVLDPSGRRVGKKKNGTLQWGWIYQSFLRPAAEVDASGQVVSRFVYAMRANVPEYLVKTGRTYRLVLDHLGSVRLVVDAISGTIVQRIDYDEWGGIMADTNPGFQPFGYAGGLYDPDTKLVRFGYRDYDPTVGRWLAKDPILFGSGQLNLYGYCRGDPINWTDPSGLVQDDAGRTCLESEIVSIVVHQIPPLSSDHLVGHRFLETPEGAIGHYPSEGNKCNKIRGEGELRNDHENLGHPNDDPRPYRACPETADILRRSISDSMDTPYGLGPGGAPNCTEWVEDMLGQAGLPNDPRAWVP